MTPGPWVGVVLALAAYRLVRLAGWDTFPLAVKARSWATGEYVLRARPAAVLGELPVDLLDETDADVGYLRPTVAHLLACPFCVGFWISVAVYGAWLAWHPVLYALVPLALSALVGLISKNFDA